MLKLRVVAAKEKPKWGVIVQGTVIDGTPSGRMKLTLPIRDRVRQFEIRGYSVSSFGGMLSMTVPEPDESEQLALMDAIEEDDFLYLETLPPANAGDSRLPTVDVD